HDDKNQTDDQRDNAVDEKRQFETGQNLFLHTCLPANRGESALPKQKPTRCDRVGSSTLCTARLRVRIREMIFRGAMHNYYTPNLYAIQSPARAYHPRRCTCQRVFMMRSSQIIVFSSTTV